MKCCLYLWGVTGEMVCESGMAHSSLSLLYSLTTHTNICPHSYTHTQKMLFSLLHRTLYWLTFHFERGSGSPHCDCVNKFMFPQHASHTHTVSFSSISLSYSSKWIPAPADRSHSLLSVFIPGAWETAGSAVLGWKIILRYLLLSTQCPTSASG